MLQPWGATNTFFDIGSVFSVNGLAPQQSFSKPGAGRYVPRTGRTGKRPSGSTESPTPRAHPIPPPLPSLAPITIASKPAAGQPAKVLFISIFCDRAVY